MTPGMMAASLASASMLASGAVGSPRERVRPPVPVVSVQQVQPDAATLDAAMHYLDAVQFEANSMRTVDLVVNASFASVVEGLQKRYGDAVPQDLLEQLHAALQGHALKTMRADLPDLKRKTAAIYASEFTRAELVRLTELASDPVAVKARERAKVMQPKLMMLGITAMRASQPELDAEIKRIISEYLAAHGGEPRNSSSS